MVIVAKYVDISIDNIISKMSELYDNSSNYLNCLTIQIVSDFETILKSPNIANCLTILSVAPGAVTLTIRQTGTIKTSSQLQVQTLCVYKTPQKPSLLAENPNKIPFVGQNKGIKHS